MGVLRAVCVPLAALALLAACHGPTFSERAGLKPYQPLAKYPNRIAPHKWAGTPRPEPTAQRPPPQATPPRRNEPRTQPQGANRRRGRAPSRGNWPDLTARDLAEVRAWIDGQRNSQWILGDHVEITVTKEFFSQVLSMNAPLGTSTLEQRSIQSPLVRHDQEVGGDRVTTLTYQGPDGSQTITGSPRVTLATGTPKTGTTARSVETLRPGLSIMARRRLVLRLTRAQDPSRPVWIRVSALGDAAWGRGEETLKRDETGLGIQGVLVRGRGGCAWRVRGP